MAKGIRHTHFVVYSICAQQRSPIGHTEIQTALLSLRTFGLLPCSLANDIKVLYAVRMAAH